jgi:uncharacterized protein
MASRLSNIDFMRTTAIFIMIIANAAPYVMETPNPNALRLICSLAAPLFIFLSGFSFYLSFSKNRNYKQKLMQGFYLMCTAVGIDWLIWGTLPFQAFDVLYLISIGIFINILIFNFHVYLKLFIALACIGASILLQNQYGYRFIIEDDFEGTRFSMEFLESLTFQFQRFFIDGWFPIFPWISFAIIGCVVAERMEDILKMLKGVLAGSLLLFVVGLTLLFTANTLQGERDGYLEFFYPASPVYLLIAFSFIFLLFTSTARFNLPKGINFINVMGRNSLFVYIFHAAIIGFVLIPFFDSENEGFELLSRWMFALLSTGFILLCCAVSFFSEWMSKNGYFKYVLTPVKQILGLK